MAKTELLQVRIDEDVKKEASQILEALGTTLSASINMYLKQIIIHKGIPFEVRIPDVEAPAKKAEAPVVEQVEEKTIEPETVVEPIVEEPVVEQVVEEVKVEEPKKVASTPVTPVILTEEERKELLKKTPTVNDESVSSNDLRDQYYKMFHIK